ncbi:hypothetical protein G6F60_010038 [Rhizopus arrhizus]|nr:hypothetical protein G6F60_010038 [Rhizopus arrhizus]
MSQSTQREHGYVEVAKERERSPVKIYYELHGDGPEHVVLIMGLNSSCLAWENQTKYLAETKRYTVLIFENRGMGLSDAPMGIYSTLQMAHDVIDLLDHFGWQKHVHLNGISMGGMIALELVSRWPSRFSSVVLTSTTPGGQIPPLKAITTFFRLIFARDPTYKLTQILSLLYPPQWLSAKPTAIEHASYETNADMSLAQYLARMDRSRPQTLIGHLGQMIAVLTHFVSEARLEKIKSSGVRCLVMTGTWDHLVNPKNSYYLSQRLGCELVVFEGSGHILPVEEPERYNRLMDHHFRHCLPNLYSFSF